MKSLLKSYEFNLSVRIVLLFSLLTATAYCLLHQQYQSMLLLLVPFLLLQVVELIRFLNRANIELAQFLEAVQYRDFSVMFNERKASPSVRKLRRAFNTINGTFRGLANEKEAQFQYLQRILEMVNTGILSYDDLGKVVWMNESLKQMLSVPYLKTIQSLGLRNQDLYDTIMQLKPGEQRIVVLRSDQSVLRVVLSSTAFRTSDFYYKLIVFQNVGEALDETEAQAWQKLLRVMTHEIMNSVAPIASLADTLIKRLHTNGEVELPITDLEMGMDAIKKRSEGLMRFADTYRNLSRTAAPLLSKVLVRELFENIYQLLEPTLDKRGIEFDVVLRDPHLSIEADTSLMEQVLINLVLNAMEAVKDRPQALITVEGYVNEFQQKVLTISDNGQGMPPEVLEKIFIPFFTTKPQGSGIGLSFSRQIMFAHRGSIKAQSVEGQGSTFTLVFPV